MTQTPASIDWQRRRCIGAILAGGWALPTAAQLAGRTLTVGPGERWRTLAEAIKAADSGDTIELQPGIYAGDVAVIAQPRLTVRGLGAGALLLADGRHAEGKATLVVRGEDVRIDNLEFRGSRVPAGNGAGIRFEAGRLSVQRCRFFDNEMGLLTAGRADMALDVLDCQFGQAPRHEGLLHHLLYVGSIGRFTLQGSRFGQGWRGHLVKTRALHNRVICNQLDDGPPGEASYELEFPNGGHNVVIGNVIAQGTATQNPALLSMGAEAVPGTQGSLVLVHNTFVNHAANGRFLHVWSERLLQPLAIHSLNNLFVGAGEVSMPPGADTAGNHAVDLTALRAAAAGDFRLVAGSPLAGQAAALPAEWVPTLSFAGPAGTRPLSPAKRLPPGAPQTDREPGNGELGHGRTENGHGQDATNR